MGRYTRLLFCALAACGQSVKTDTVELVAKSERAPVWAIGYGAEFWRASTGTPTSQAIDRVGHALHPRGPEHALAVHDPAFDVSYRDGLTLTADGTRISLRTSKISIGERHLDLAGRRWSALGNTVQTLVDPAHGVVEHHEVTHEGVEIAWIVQRPPHEDVSIELTTAIDGDPAAIRIGDATLVDATGARWPIATDHVDGGLRWHLPAALLAKAIFPVALDPSVGPAHTFAGGGLAALATSGTDYLLVSGGSGGNIIATRVTSSGVIEDLDGIPVASSGNHIAAAWNGSSYLVVWDEVLGAKLSCARIAADGSLLDATPIVLATSAPYGDLGIMSHISLPAVASAGSSFEVVWTDDRCNSPDPGSVGCVGDRPGIYGRQVAADGTLLAETAITTVGEYYDPPSNASLASNGNGYALTWGYPSNYDGLELAKMYAMLDASGAPGFTSSLTLSGIAGADYGGAAAVASNGSDFLAVWGDGTTIRASRIAADGTIPASDMNGFPVVATHGSGAAPVVASNGADYLVVQNDIDAPRALAAERVSDATGAVVPSDAGGFAVASQTGGIDPTLVGAPGLPYLVAYRSTPTATDYRLIDPDASTCGDAVVDVAETCDDGDTDSGDGCSSSCAIEHGFHCTGQPSVCTDDNECATGNGGCGQVCTNLPGSFACSCNTGYVLASDGHTCNDVDECATSNGGCAQTCTNSAGSYACSCGSGYALAGDGHGCDDVDECATGNGGCAQTCTNSTGSYACSCGSGYALDGDGHGCNDVDECTTSNGGCAQTCTNSAGTYTCSCDSGYVLDGDGHGCSDIDECATANGGCTQTCTNATGSYACSCSSGYTLAADDHGCDDIDECATANGGCAQTCTNMPGSFACSCQSGYALSADLHSCNDIDECSTGTATCDEHARCLNTTGAYDCICLSGYEGDGQSCTPHDGGCSASSPGSWGLVVLAFGLVPVRRRRKR
jgi:fibulin 1/2